MYPRSSPARLFLYDIAVDSRSPEVRGRYLAAYQLSWNVAGILAPARSHG